MFAVVMISASESASSYTSMTIKVNLGYCIEITMHIYNIQLQVTQM